MSTTTILHEYERRLRERVEKKEITQKTADGYLNDASRVVEVLLAYVPVAAIQGYMEAAGYQGDYGQVIEQLMTMTREPGRSTFYDIKPKGRAMTRRKGRAAKSVEQKTLPGMG